MAFPPLNPFRVPGFLKNGLRHYEPMDTMPIPFSGLRFAHTLPHMPGIYRYYDARDRLLYVGKAKDLQKRVLSYFQKTPEDPRIATMVAQIARAEFTVVRSEVEALVLESRLIKEENPHYNIRLREGHGYPYLHLSTHKKVPQLTVHRFKRGREGRFFGPFPSRESVYEAHDLLQKHFGLRTCSDHFFSHRSRPCLEYQIGRCSAPCVNKISPEEYQERVAELESFLDGKSEALIATLGERMERAADSLAFEQAALWRDRIGHLRQMQGKLAVETGEGSFDAVACAVSPALACVSVVNVRRGQVIGARTFRLVPPLGANCPQLLAQFIAQTYISGEAPMPGELLVPEDPDDHEALEAALEAKAGRKVAVRSNVRTDRRMQLDLAVRNADAGLAAALQSDSLMTQRRLALASLLNMEAPPQRIECFDISHTQGELAVASCVVFGPEGPQKGSYRRFNIQGITPGDDYAAIRQAVERRLVGKEPPPDLMLIDGGAGQVAEAVEVARGLNFTFPIVGVSKGPDRRPGEEVLIVDDGKRSIKPGASSPGLHLIQAVRDEAHRFALKSHRQRREKARVTSPLESIPGIGPGRRQALLKAFGGLAGLKQATVDDIAKVPQIGVQRAQLIAQALKIQGGLL